jgi:pimeloyl-ACP methyl ester carboxylesterase
MDKERDRVLLIHGLWMNGLELTLLRRRLRKAGFRTRRFHYPTLRASLEANARRLAHCIESNQPRHIVAHSLGGLVTLRAFEIGPDLPVERVVFMAAPVRGSSVARALMARRWGGRLLGQSGPGVLAASHEPAWRFAPALGVLAGTQSAGLGRTTTRFDGANDGTVAVAETFIDGAADNVTVNAGHMTLVVSREAADQVTHFLRHGCFQLLSPRERGWGEGAR